MERAIIEGLDKHDRLQNPNDAFYNNLQGYALDKMSFYNCFDCNQPYFGGMRRCGE